MHVSHLGLSVSDKPSSTSFYLAALQPLGYRFIGRQGDSIGLGIEDADLFLTQAEKGTKVSPTHIAFTAHSQLAVRNCYAAALNAGGWPSGAPGKRNDECSCFNAAVTDPDGHTIEFIFRETPDGEACHSAAPPSEYTYAGAGTESIARSRYQDDDRSIASKASRAKSRAQTALDLASATSKSTRQSITSAPAPGLTRSRTEPLSTDGSRKLVGTLLGAAAGAAIAYVAQQAERDSARQESEYARSRLSSARLARTRSNYERPAASRVSSSRSKITGRERMAIEPRSYSDDDFPDVMSRYTSSRRPEPQRSRTYDAIEYSPRTASSTRSARSERHRPQRSTTLPADLPDNFFQAPKLIAGSRYSSRRGSMPDEGLKRHDSAVSVQSSRSRRSADGSRRSSASQASTVKPSRRGSTYGSAAEYPLPSSKASSSMSSALKRPLPASRASSYATGLTAANISLPPSRYSDLAEESDGMDDTKTIVPEDSISCIDFSTKSKSKHGRSTGRGSSRHSSSKRSEADSDRTVRPAKTGGSRHSAQTLPTRLKEDYSRSGREGKWSTRSHN
ncbi:uncharacterized protein LTR77_002990 [Saxophila tyrrhenica]|uniref:VOC domain-containing protein n=1 Tax=Saxophila tyrrhenica TaxID=1690608 RepID=A0AAV9PGZ7_9PEZI|nr:hypothetical protein LTR77_002990 [Saxophila tyrrhenica]